MIDKNFFVKFSILLPYILDSLLNLLYAITAGIAASKPNAVANNASAIPGATTDKLPKDIYYFSCEDVEDKWIVYPWDNPNFLD